MYNINELKAAARGRWGEIITTICGLQNGLFTGRHQQCPTCGGRDRFRVFRDFDETGGMICGQCFNHENADGFGVIQWLTKCDFPTSLKHVGDYLGIQAKKVIARKKRTGPALDQLQFVEWNDQLAVLWCMRKRPITVDALNAVGARMARHNRYTVIAIPTWRMQVGEGDPCGWILYEVTNGPLPTKAGKSVEWVKVKTLAGSQPGFAGRPGDPTQLVIKTEGPSDMLGALSMPGIPPGVGVVCNANGAKEDPDKNPWVQGMFTNRPAWVIHDCDQPGQEGATFIVRNDGAQRPGWAPAIARYASDCKNVDLGFPLKPTHGQDLRDWITAGGTFEQLTELAAKGESFTAADALPPEITEAPDDPHRLARVNLERYSNLNEGAAIRMWRHEWYTWKRSRGCYRVISESDLRAKLTASIKLEFNRIHIEEKLSGQEEDNTVRKVTKPLVSNVMNALASMTLVSEHINLNTWLDNEDEDAKGRHFIAVRNGLLDLNALLAGDDANSLRQHSPNWFTLTCLDYDFDPAADCPTWKRVLEQNLEGDSERLALIQEWAGYLLIQNTDQQKMMILEGEGANGKTVFMSGLEAIIGKGNCSHVPIESFADRFSKTQTLGMLANIISDCSDIEPGAEGILKDFICGVSMFFDRKNLPGITSSPTARIVVGTNNPIRFNDKSGGMWRRLTVMPFRRMVPISERVLGMDKSTWWRDARELPGMLNWAIAGLHRLRANGGFTVSKICEERLKAYKREMNPALDFLLSFFSEERSTGENKNRIKCDEIFRQYQNWCSANGYRSLGNSNFGREILRVFPTAEKKRSRENPIDEKRFYFWFNIRLKNENQIDFE